MEVEKRTSKGGFLHLFDWGVKSRKKLFSDSSSSELPVGREEAKDNIEKLPTSRFRLIDVNENKSSSSNKGSNEYNCASSVTSDECNGARALGVVVRLMGLDSLPTSNVCEPCSTSFIDSSSFKDSNYNGTYSNLRRDRKPNNIMHSKVEEFTNPVISEPEILQNRKIKRFQTEVLPRKSAKPIPVTHNKLLSPIKNPGFIPMKNKDYTMEVAAKMIEPSPQSNRTSFVSSSVPIRIRDLKEKMEAVKKVSRIQRPKETDSGKQTNVQLHQKNSNTQKRSGTSNTSMVKVCMDEEKCSSGSLKSMGKSSSFAATKKVIDQSSDSPTSSSNERSMNHKKPNEIKSNNQAIKSQINGHKRTLNGRTSNVLQQNNNKQNNTPNKDKSTSKTSFSNQQPRKYLSANASCRARNIGLTPTVAEKELSPSRPKTSPRKKKSFDESVYAAERVLDSDILIHKDGRSIRRNTVIDGSINWGTDKKKDGNDIVSFTFSSPIKKPISESRPSDQSVQKNGRYDVSRRQNESVHGLNIIGADALSILLEQKLREFTYKIESPGCNLVEMGPSTMYSLQLSAQNHILPHTASVESETRSQVSAPKVTSDSLYDSDDTSVHDLVLKPTQEQQDEHGSDHQEREPGEVEILYPVQPSFPGLQLSYDNCYSSESRHDHGRKHYKEVNSILEKDPRSAEDETDSVSSTFTVDTGFRHNPLASLTDFITSSNWELQYIRDVLENAEFMVDKLALGQACQIITPNLFDQVEMVGSWEGRSGRESAKLERKVLFDCVRECLETKCRHLYIGNCETRAKWFTLFRRKGWLVYELYKDTSGLKNMEDLMVDGLVDKDMSTELGKWLDFKIEVLEKGVEVQEGILDYLVDELVSDLFL